MNEFGIQKIFQSLIRIMNQMENFILKNQKELHQILPVPQIGSKFSKLAERFASKSNYDLHKKVLPKDDKIFLKDDTVINQELASKTNKINQNRRMHSRVESSFEGTQLEYFRMVNRQQKDQIFKLREDLKFANDKISKAVEQKKKAEQKLFLCHRTMNRTERKIFTVMQMAHHLILSIKKNIGTENEQQADENLQPVDLASSLMEYQGQVQNQLLQELSQEKRKSSNPKKKNINYMLDERSRAKKMHAIESKSFTRPKDDLFDTFNNFLKSVKDLLMLQKLLQNISNTFDSSIQSSNLVKQRFSTQNQSQQYVFEQIDSLFTTILQNNQMQLNSNNKFHSGVVSVTIKPISARQKLFNSIKEIFDHQIYLLENQKMIFLQYKNKRLLKFIYECSGCEKYEDMFGEIFRIMREGFRQIKLQIIPELEEKPQNDNQSVL